MPKTGDGLILTETLISIVIFLINNLFSDLNALLFWGFDLMLVYLIVNEDTKFVLLW